MRTVRLTRADFRADFAVNPDHVVAIWPHFEKGNPIVGVSLLVFAGEGLVAVLGTLDTVAEQLGEDFVAFRGRAGYANRRAVVAVDSARDKEGCPIVGLTIVALAGIGKPMFADAPIGEVAQALELGGRSARRSSLVGVQ